MPQANRYLTKDEMQRRAVENMVAYGPPENPAWTNPFYEPKGTVEERPETVEEKGIWQKFLDWNSSFHSPRQVQGGIAEKISNPITDIGLTIPEKIIEKEPKSNEIIDDAEGSNKYHDFHKEERKKAGIPYSSLHDKVKAWQTARAGGNVNIDPEILKTSSDAGQKYRDVLGGLLDKSDQNDYSAMFNLVDNWYGGNQSAAYTAPDDRLYEQRARELGVQEKLMQLEQSEEQIRTERLQKLLDHQQAVQDQEWREKELQYKALAADQSNKTKVSIAQARLDARNNKDKDIGKIESKLSKHIEYGKPGSSRFNNVIKVLENYQKENNDSWSDQDSEKLKGDVQVELINEVHKILGEKDISFTEAFNDATNDVMKKLGKSK